MSTKRTAVLLFAIAVIMLFVGLMIGASTQVITATVTTTTTSLVTTSVQGQGGLSTVTVQSPSGGLVEYCFSAPGGQTDCASRLIYWFNQAHVTIHIMIYSFTLSQVAQALIQAKQRGVDVKIAWDKTEVNVQGSQYQNLVNAGIPIRIDHESGIELLHDKVAIVDGQIILTGSFNWSAEANLHDRENLIVINGQAWAAAYEQNFQEIWAAST